jgi:hypothetical protein
MPTVKLSPLFNSQTLKSTGVPASGHKINTYAAGSSSALATYTSSSGDVTQENPITLNSNGLPDNEIWLQSGLIYKFVWTDESDVVIDTFDNISGINDTSTSATQWQASGVTPTYVSGTSFTLPGDQTSEFHVGRKGQFTVSAGTVYGTISASAYATLTTVTVALDGGALDSGLSGINLSLLRADHPAAPIIASANIASASTINLTTLKGDAAHITGATAITAVTMINGQVADVVFDGILTLTHHATNNNLPGGANITTAAGDRARYFYDGATVYCLSYARANGTSVVPVIAATQTQMEAASSNAVFSAPSNQQFHPSAAKAWVIYDTRTGAAAISASYNVSSITDNGTGDVTVNFTSPFSSANYAFVGSGSGTGAGANSLVIGDDSTFAKATNAFRCVWRSQNGTATDANYCSLVFYGDQA